MPFVGFNKELGKKTLGIDTIDNPKKHEWVCPHCKSKLSHVKEHIRRNESQVIEHFRHEKLCPFHTERDTITHLQMKKWIFNSFKKKYPKIIMEHKIGNHITDVAIFGMPYSFGNFAIECQVSHINPIEIIERTEEYTNHGFYTLWILHTDFLENTSGVYYFHRRDRGYYDDDYEVVYNLYKFRHFMKTLHELYQYRIFFLNPQTSEFFVVRFTGRKWKTKKYARMGNVTNLQLLCSDLSWISGELLVNLKLSPISLSCAGSASYLSPYFQTSLRTIVAAILSPLIEQVAFFFNLKGVKVE